MAEAKSENGVMSGSFRKEDFAEGTAAAKGLAVCHQCAAVERVEMEYCPACGTLLHLRDHLSVAKTIAYTVASVVLYIPANILPIMEVSGLGGAEENTILGGVFTFWEMGSYPVAIIIFTASVLIPILKMLAIFRLCWAAKFPAKDPKKLTKMYHYTELVGRWSMVDVFVVVVLVALVQMGTFMSITPGPAALAFGGVVVLTMIGAHAFDPRLIWDRVHQAEREKERVATSQLALEQS